MKKVSFYLSLGLIFGALVCSLEGATDEQGAVKNRVNSPASKEDRSTTQEKFNIMERDENEDTDTLAIPLDDSEVEDEEQLNYDEGKNEFNLPEHRR